MTSPVLIEISRGPLTESVHRGRVCIARAEGEQVLALGDTGSPVYPRSGIKALQAIALVERGGAEAFALSDKELAVICASHGGEPEHVETVSGILGKIGLDESALACGAHWPMNEAAAHALAAAGERPGAIHNNCSGKHAGMLALAVHMQVEPAGYEKPDHPVQAAIRETIEAVCGRPASADRCAVDGCSVPTWALPLSAWAQGFARFAVADGMPEARAEACRKLMHACTAHPSMVAGKGRFDTAAMTRLGQRAFLKGGAEGVHCAALPELGLGVAVKIDDGARRAAEAVMAAVLAAVFRDDLTGMGDVLELRLANWRGRSVGAMAPSEDLIRSLKVLRE